MYQYSCLPRATRLTISSTALPKVLMITSLSRLQWKSSLYAFEYYPVAEVVKLETLDGASLGA